ncbi:MAG: sulfatase activating formylglycine-generating enzyme [Pirellulaceae bacterium]|jgi:formylglycine-generating enzyme required for sulfatase activity
MFTAILLMSAITVDPVPEQTKLLKTFRDEFISITPGEGKFPKRFEMGNKAGPKNEQPAHNVTFDYNFEVAKYEVPQNLWEAVMGSNPSRWKGPRNSVEMFDVDEAVSFCDKATKLMRAAKLIKENQRVRVPSEAEWEYVARAGTATTYSFGDDASKLGDYGWSTHNAAGNDPPVGAKKPNPWGLYDVHGYLWELCIDAPSANYEKAPNDGSAAKGEKGKAVARGGSWKDKAELLTSSYRSIISRKVRDDALGLRCVLDTD